MRGQIQHIALRAAKLALGDDKQYLRFFRILTHTLIYRTMNTNYSSRTMNHQQLVGIVGGGIVGGAVKHFFQDALVYDKYKKLDPITAVARQRFIFICVPTPYENGLDLSAVNDAVAN